jgi:hypothetical protein
VRDEYYPMVVFDNDGSSSSWGKDRGFYLLAEFLAG